MTELLRNFAQVLAQLAPYLLVGFTVAGLLHAYLPVGLLARHLGKPGFASVAKAALFGVPLPLCSCGVVPVAIELRKSGASRGATAAFLVATPETGVDSIAASVAVLHPLLVVFRPLAALLTAIVTGVTIERFAPAATDPDPPADAPPSCCSTTAPPPPQENRLLSGLRYGYVDLFGDIARYLLPATLITAAMS